MGKVVVSTKFFHYNQNNSGGSFVFDEDRGITHHVFVEAIDSAHADMLAEKIGLYFDGYGDCECCGDRWSTAYAGDAEDTPILYGQPVSEFTGHRWMAPGKESVVHYLDGRKEWFGVE